jgi:hypothetical protein
VKARKLASGKYSITDISENDMKRLLDAVEEQRKRFLFAVVPARGGKGVRSKMDLTANDYAVIGKVVGEALY